MFQRMGGVHRPCSPQHHHGEHPLVCACCSPGSATDPCVTTAAAAGQIDKHYPSVMQVCLEWWLYECIILMTGQLAEAEINLGVAGVVFQIASVCYMPPIGLQGKRLSGLCPSCPARADRARHVLDGPCELDFPSWRQCRGDLHADLQRAGGWPAQSGQAGHARGPGRGGEAPLVLLPCCSPLGSTDARRALHQRLLLCTPKWRVRLTTFRPEVARECGTEALVWVQLSSQVTLAVALFFGRSVWGYALSSDPEVVRRVAGILFIISFMLPSDGLIAVSSGELTSRSPGA